MKEVKKGDKVWIFNTHRGGEPMPANVISVGPKYITVDNVGNYMNKYDKRNGYGIKDTNYTLYTSKDGYTKTDESVTQIRKAVGAFESYLYTLLDREDYAKIERITNKYIKKDENNQRL